MADSNTFDLSQIGGPADIEATVDSLQSQLANNPVQPAGVQAYNQYRKEIDMHQPGLPEAEKERLAIQQAQMYLGQQQAMQQKKFASENAASLRIDDTNAKRAQLGLPLLPGGSQPTQGTSPNVNLSANDFAQPMQPGQTQAGDPMQSVLNEQQGLINRQKNINASLADAGVQKAQFDAEKQRELAKQFEMDQYNQRVKQAEQQNVLNGYMDDMERSAADYKKFLASPEAKVKTNNLWENMGTGQKVLAGISLALGALGSGNTGKNGAVEIIQNAINQDIDAQKSNIKLQAEGKLQNYNVANNVYAQMLKKYQNEDMAEAATRLLRTQQVQMQMNAVASDYQGTQVKKQQELANAALDQSMLQLKTQFAQAAQQQAMFKSMGMDPQTAAVSAMPKEIQERFVPGYGFASNANNAQEFQKKRAESEPAISGLERVLDASKNFNRLDMTKRTQISTELAALIGQLRVPLTGPGAFTEKEYDRVASTIGNPTAFAALPSWERLKIQTVLNKFKSDLDNSASQYGLPRKNKNIQLKTLGKPE